MEPSRADADRPTGTASLSFEGKRVVITGAASGIGAATARAFAAAGGRVALLDVDAAGVETVRASLPGGDHLALECDVASVQATEQAFARVTALGGIDVLVNNAGINPPAASTTAIDEAFYDRVMDVNVKGMFFCARAAIEPIAGAGGGAIVNLASVSGMIGWGGSSVYSASKGAAIALTKFLAVELAPRGIRVNAVCPGSVRTPMVERNFERLADPDQAWRETAALHPLGCVGEAAEITEAILYLASPRSSFVTGACLVIDGGLTAR